MFGQVQVGQSIVSTNPDENFGSGIAISDDGNRIVIGAPGESFQNDVAGFVYAYEWDGFNWNQMGQTIEGDSLGEQFGFSVAFSSNGSILAVGAQRSDINGLESGLTKVYEWNGTNWVQRGSDIPGGSSSSLSGHSVALSKDGLTLAIGAVIYDTNTPNSGQVRVYKWMSNDWIQMGQSINGSIQSERFGASISLSADGSRIVIGAPLNNEVASFAGRVSIYDWDGTNWMQIGASLYGDAENDWAGYPTTISDDGNRIGFGLPVWLIDNSEFGRARIFDWDGNNWTQVGSDFEGALGEDLGRGISLTGDGNTVAISTPRSDTLGGNTGIIDIYDWNGNFWMKTGNTMIGPNTDSFFGFIVKLTSDGSRIAVTSASSVISPYVAVYDLNLTSSIYSETPSRSNVSVFPNPTNGIFTIHSDKEIVHAKVKITDASGKLQLIEYNKTDNVFDISSLPSGAYYIESIDKNNLTAITKIVKQ